MERYVGTKVVKAAPITRRAYNQFRGWKLPEDENGEDVGYLVVQSDSDSNTGTYNGYVSWSPKVQFEATYENLNLMSFESAIHLAKRGVVVTRSAWDGSGEVGLSKNQNHLYLLRKAEQRRGSMFIELYKPDHNDMVANDWTVVQIPNFNVE